MSVDKKLRQLLEKFYSIPVTCICDVCPDARILNPEIKAVAPGRKLVGVARTVRAEGDILPVLHAIGFVEHNEILVIESGDTCRAQCGELLAAEAKRRGAAGIVLDGACRDVSGITEVGLPVYARGVCAAKADSIKVGGQQLQIVCGGEAIVPGDIICADDDGIVALTVEVATDILPELEKLKSREENMLQQIKNGADLLEMINFDEHRITAKEAARYLADTVAKIT